MTVIGEWMRRLWYLLNRRRFEAALEQDMEAHRAMMGDPVRFGNRLRLREDPFKTLFLATRRGQK